HSPPVLHAPPRIRSYTLSLPDALPISLRQRPSETRPTRSVPGRPTQTTTDRNNLPYDHPNVKKITHLSPNPLHPSAKSTQAHSRRDHALPRTRRALPRTEAPPPHTARPLPTRHRPGGSPRGDAGGVEIADTENGAGVGRQRSAAVVRQQGGRPPRSRSTRPGGRPSRGGGAPRDRVPPGGR